MTKVQTRLASDSRASLLTYRVVRSLVCWFTQAFTRMHIDGREHLPPTGAYILAPVHRSYVDTPIVACVTRRRIRFMGKQEMWKYPSLGWLFSALGAFPVNRGTADREALVAALELSGRTDVLAVAPLALLVPLVWLAVGGVQDASIEQYAQPIEAPMVGNRPISGMPQLARDALDAVGISLPA